MESDAFELLSFGTTLMGNVLLVVFLIIRKIVKDKKAGKSAVCGGDCSKCHANCSHKN